MSDSKEVDPRVSTVKHSLYLDDDSDDELLSLYVQAADAYVRGAITDNADFYSDPRVKPLFDEAVTSLAATYYKYRLSLSETATYPIDLTTNSIIAQLRGTFDEFQDEQENADN